MSEPQSILVPKGDRSERDHGLPIADWIVEQGLVATSLGTLVDGLARRLCEAGLPLWRLHLTVATLHPTLTAFGGTWRRDRGFNAEEFTHASEQQAGWQQSPLLAMLGANCSRMRRCLEGRAAEVDFPMLAELQGQGATDWFGQLVRFGPRRREEGVRGMLLSWASDRAGGFCAADIALIERLVPNLALACYRLALENAAENLLEAYIGADAGTRILAGQVRRGAATRLSAALMIADLRGFTRAADELPGERLLAGLNDYLGDVVETIVAHGGEVLKFLGDGLLAIFSLEDREAASVCGEALAAAEAALAGNAARNVAREAAGEPVLTLDIALHLGELMYGNVGSARRLDFTVIGPAVNEASRIESLCAELGRPLLISESFARAVGPGLRSLGRHALRGVAKPQELFTLV